MLKNFYFVNLVARFTIELLNPEKPQRIMLELKTSTAFLRRSYLSSISHRANQSYINIIRNYLIFKSLKAKAFLDLKTDNSIMLSSHKKIKSFSSAEKEQALKLDSIFCRAHASRLVELLCFLFFCEKVVLKNCLK